MTNIRIPLDIDNLATDEKLRDIPCCSPWRSYIVPYDTPLSSICVVLAGIDIDTSVRLNFEI